MNREDYEAITALAHEGIDDASKVARLRLADDRDMRMEFYSSLSKAQEQYYFRLCLTILGELGGDAARDFQDHALNDLNWMAHHQTWHLEAVAKFKREQGDV